MICREMRHIFLLLVMLLTAVSGYGVTARANWQFTDKGQKLAGECELIYGMRQYSRLPAKAAALKSLGRHNHNQREELVGESYALRASIHLRDTADLSARIATLQQRIQELDQDGELPTAMELCYTVSVYHHFINSDYSEALKYASLHLEMAERENSDRERLHALTNIAAIHVSKHDDSGLEYAVRCYDLARRLDNKPGFYTAACNRAAFLYNTAQYTEARRYLQEAVDMASTLGFDMEQSYLDSFMGEILSELGDIAGAEKYFLKSINPNEQVPLYDEIYSNFSYGLFLRRHNREQQAEKILLNALSLSHKHKINIFLPLILLNLSEHFETVGNTAMALDYFKQYAEAYRQAVTEEKEREFAILNLRNKISEEQSKNALQQMEITRIILISASIFVLLAAGFIFFWMYHRRKTRSNEALVSQYLNNLEAEKALRSQLERALEERRVQEKPRSSLTDDRQGELFEALQK